MRKLAWGATVSLAALMTASAALAADENGTATIDEIVVTGQKRAENLQQVAAAATVIAGSSLQERGITRMDGLQTAVPSLSITDAGLTQSVNIRGVGLASGSPNAANGVATYFDGVFQPPIVSTNSFYDIGAIEVFRGPQGTFVGSNSTGGAIFINSRDPEIGEASGYVEGEFGRYSRAGANAAVNMPLSDTLAVRVAGIYRTRDSYYHRLDGATPPASLDEQGGRLSIKWKPTDNFSALLKGEIDRKSTDGYAYRPTPSSAFAAARTGDLYTLNYNTPTRNDEKGDQLTGKLDYVTDGGLTLRSISGYQNKRITNVYDSDGTSLASNTQNQFVRERVWTEEVNVLSPTAGPVSYILGGYFQRNKIDIDIVNNAAAPVHTKILGSTRKTTTGVFGQVTWKVTPQLSLDVGGRYSWYKVDGGGGVFLVTPAPTPTFLTNPGGHEKDNQFTGKVALNWTPSDDHLIYAFVAKGYKSGGLQSLTSNFAPEKVIDYEIGWKGTYLGGALTSQVGAFYYDYKNFQLDALNATTGQNAVINLTNAKVKGVEGQIQAHLDAFRISAGVGYTDSALAGATFVDVRGVARAFPGVNNAPQCPAGQPSRPPACLDYTPFLRSTAGGPNLFSPKWTWNLDASYRFEAGAVAITPRASLSHVGGRWAYIGYNPQRDYLPGFTQLNANLEFEAGRYTVDVFATNLTQERHVTGQIGGGANEFYGAPREYGVRARAEF